MKSTKQHCRANENLYDLKGEVKKWQPVIFRAKHDWNKSIDFNPYVIRRLCILIPAIDTQKSLSTVRLIPRTSIESFTIARVEIGPDKTAKVDRTAHSSFFVGVDVIVPRYADRKSP